MTDTNTPSPTTPADVIAALDARVLNQILTLNKSLPTAFQGIAPVYAAAVVRIVQDKGIADLTALYGRLSGLTTPAALDTLHAKMTSEELTAEKVQLDALWLKAATDNYNAHQLVQQIIGAAISAALGLALRVVTF